MKLNIMKIQKDSDQNDYDNIKTLLLNTENEQETV